MCGRFALTLPHEAMADLFDATPGQALMPTPRYNICPTQQIPVVRAGENGRRLMSMRWGFLPSWYKMPADGPLLINARAESIADKPAFRSACRTRRCIIPATGFYEWTKDKDGARLPWYIYPADAPVIALAGIWQDWQGGDGQNITTCAIVTTAANDHLAHIHHRMPVTLAPVDYGLWLGEAGQGAARVMISAPEERFAYHRVAATVNSNRAQGPDLIDERFEV